MALPVQIGEVVEGRYKIVRPLADGGMGTVFLAEHWLIKRKVAIKVLHADLATDVTILRRFMNEALAAGTLGHPHIVEAMDMGYTNNHVPFIVFEYLEGTSLADEITQVQQLPIARALSILDQIASALGAAHSAGIIHRDLKSDNIFLAKRGATLDHVKVLDFGISRFATATDKTALGGNLLGTPEFMAPEQVTSPEHIDHRADIYALGVLLFEMLAGHVPFVLAKQNDIDAAHALLARVVNEPAPALPIAAPPGVGAFLAKLLAKDPRERYQTTADVQRALLDLGELGELSELAGTAPTAREIDREIVDISDKTVSRSRLTPTALALEVKQLGKRWSLVGEELVLELHDRHFAKLAELVTHAGQISDEMELQPRIAIDYPRLRLVLSDGASVAELVFAARVEQWLREHGW